LALLVAAGPPLRDTPAPGMVDRPTALASLARYAVEAAKRVGLDSARLIVEAGLVPDVVADIDGRVPVEGLLRLWELCAERSGDPVFGLHAAENLASPQTVHVVGFAARTSATMGDAIATVGRFARVMNETTSFALLRQGAISSLRVGPGPGCPRWPRVYAEVVISGYLFVGRFLAGGAQECLGATFHHPAPRDVSEYHRVFGPNVEFSAAVNSLSFRSEVLDLPVRFADPALSDYLRAQAAAMLEKLPAGGALRQRVRHAVSERLGDATEIRKIARRLGVSSRTLQRSLREEGTSFQEIRDEVRRCVALDLLREQSLSVSEIAALVGYANTSAFRSAIRRWTGGSARDARRAVRELDESLGH